MVLILSLIASSSCFREKSTLRQGSVDVRIDPGVGIATGCAVGMTASEILDRNVDAIVSDDATLISLTNIGVVAYMGFQCAGEKIACYGVAFKVGISKYDDSGFRTMLFRGKVNGIERSSEITWRAVILAFGVPMQELINSDVFDFRTSCVHYFNLPNKPRKKLVYPSRGISFIGDYDSNGPDEIFVFNPVMPE